MNTSSAVALKADSKPQAEERTVPQQAVEGAGKTRGSKSCQQQKDIGVKALNQHNGLPSVNQDHAGKQNVPAKAHDVDRALCPDVCCGTLVHQKPRENENKAPQTSTVSRDAAPSTSQAVSDAGCEVTRTR